MFKHVFERLIIEMCMPSTETSINKMISKTCMFKTQCQKILQIIEAILRQSKAVDNVQLTFPLRIKFF